MKKHLLVALVLLQSTILIAQTSYTASDESKVVVKGTSTLHDWEADAEKITAKGSLVIENQQISNVPTFTMEIPVTSLESGKGAMNKNMYKALKEDDHPNISFQIQDVESNGSKLDAKGKLSIAGTTKTIDLNPSYKVNNSQVTINGSYTMKMTEWGIDPPTAMFGTIKTGDEITIDYELILTK